MTTIYVLNQGEYSDKHIVALYSTKKLAEEAQKLCPDSYIDEYKLDSKEIPEHPPGHTAWVVDINAKSNRIVWTCQIDSLNGRFEPEETYYDGCGYSRDSKILAVKCWARDQEHAQKIALDKFYQWKCN